MNLQSFTNWFKQIRLFKFLTKQTSRLMMFATKKKKKKKTCSYLNIGYEDNN